MPIDVNKLKDEYNNSQAGKNREAAIAAFIAQVESECLQLAKNGQGYLKIAIPADIPQDHHYWFTEFQPLMVNVEWDENTAYLTLSGWDK